MPTVDFAITAYKQLPPEEQAKFAKWYEQQQSPNAKPKRKTTVQLKPEHATIEAVDHMVRQSLGLC